MDTELYYDVVNDTVEPVELIVLTFDFCLECGAKLVDPKDDFCDKVCRVKHDVWLDEQLSKMVVS